METKETLKLQIEIHQDALSFANSHKNKMILYKKIEFLEWRVSMIAVEEKRKKARK
jgi:hypothetical protein